MCTLTKKISITLVMQPEFSCTRSLASMFLTVHSAFVIIDVYIRLGAIGSGGVEFVTGSREWVVDCIGSVAF